MCVNYDVYFNYVDVLIGIIELFFNCSCGFFLLWVVFLVIIYFVMLLWEGILNIILSIICLIIEWRLCVLVLCLIVFFVILIRVVGLNLSFILLSFNICLYCFIKVFFGFVKMEISVVLFNCLSVVIIGKWLINLGIKLNFSKFFGIMWDK